MSDLQFLFIILGVLYVWECACWLRRGGVAFNTWLGTHWRSQHPALLLGNQNGGFIFAAPFPPLGSLHFAHQLPFSLGPEGVLFFVSATANPGWRPAQSGRFLNWSALAEARLRGKQILLGKEILHAAATTTRAAQLFRALQEISNLPADQRANTIHQILRDTLDLKQIAALRQEFARQVRPLRMLTNALFVLVFLLAPLLIATLGLKFVWLWLLVPLLALTITTASFFSRLHRKFWPGATDDRFTQTLIIALAPATAMRAHDIAARPLLENFHPLAVAQQVFAPEQFRHFARRRLLDLRHPARPISPNPQPAAMATELFFRRTYLETIETWLTANKIAPAELYQPPARTDKSCQTYCPRCEAQFTTNSGACADCGGIPLHAFDAVNPT
jgi:hypothetical protein